MEINFRAENEIEFVCEYNYINFRFRFVVDSSSIVRAILEGLHPGGANVPQCVLVRLCIEIELFCLISCTSQNDAAYGARPGSGT